MQAKFKLFADCPIWKTAISTTLALLLLFPAASVIAAPGDLDPSFGLGGKITGSFGAGYDEIDDITVQADGKIIVVGYSGSPSAYKFYVARYLSNGLPDTSFGIGGKVATSFPSVIPPIEDSRPHDVQVQPDGKIVVAGETNGSFFSIARYNPDGSLDSRFANKGKLSFYVGGPAQAVALQNDGKILLAGANGTVVRLTSKGNFDNSFGSSGIAQANGLSETRGMALQADGRIVLAGSPFSGSTTSFGLARFNTDGMVDAGFGLNGIATASVGNVSDAAFALALHPVGGYITVAGYAESIPGGRKFALVQFNL